MRVNFTQAPRIDGWSLSYMARNSSADTLAVNSMVDVIQVFSSDPEVKMLQELRHQMPPDDLPPDSTYGNWVDIDASLADGTYSVYVMLDDDGDGPTSRLVITVAGGAVTNQTAD